MKLKPSLTFKIAAEPWEFEAIHRLNYQTFVEEIPQHHPNPDGRLVDRFHDENTYCICLAGEHLVGMLALRGNRPFSLDLKLPNLDSYLPAGRRVIEVRLLSVTKKHRTGGVLVGLLKILAEWCIPQGYNFAVISGTVRQQKLYKHLGFVPFGPLVGTPPAEYQPMCLTLEVFGEAVGKFLTGDNANATPPGPTDA